MSQKASAVQPADHNCAVPTAKSSSRLSGTASHIRWLSSQICGETMKRMNTDCGYSPTAPATQPIITSRYTYDWSRFRELIAGMASSR